MSKQKDFDCVEMKSKIQEELLREERELGPQEARRRQWEQALNDPLLGPFLRNVAARARRTIRRIEKLKPRGAGSFPVP